MKAPQASVKIRKLFSKYIAVQFSKFVISLARTWTREKFASVKIYSRILTRSYFGNRFVWYIFFRKFVIM